MPRVAYHHTVDRRGPREQDFGYLFALCRDEGLYVHRPAQRGAPYVITKGHAEIFRGTTIPECVRALRERLRAEAR